MGRAIGRKMVGLPQQSFGNSGGAGASIQATDNFALQFDTPHPQTQTNVAANGVPIMAAALHLKYSGTVRVDCDILFGDNTTAKTVQHTLVIIPVTSPTTRFVGAGSGTVESTNVSVGRDVYQDSGLNHASDWAATLTSDAAGLPANSMKFNGVVPNLAASGAQQFWTRTVNTLTGLLNQPGQYGMSFHGISPNFTNLPPNEQFPADGTITIVVAVLLVSTSGTDLVTYGECFLQLSENPTP